MKVLIEKEFKDLQHLLESTSDDYVRFTGDPNDIYKGVDQHYYLPYVFKKLEDGRFEMILIQKLNKELKETLIKD